MSYRSKKAKSRHEQDIELERATSPATHSTSVENRTCLPVGSVTQQATSSKANVGSHGANQVRQRSLEANPTRHLGPSSHARQKAGNSETNPTRHSGLGTVLRERKSTSEANSSSFPSNFVRQKATNSEANSARPPKPRSQLQPSRARDDQTSSQSHEFSEPEREVNSQPSKPGNVGSKSNAARTRSLKSKTVVPNWPDKLEFDEKNEVLTIDAEGKYVVLSGSIQPRDINNLGVGVRCVVHFNEFNQPIRRGGSVFVRYLGYMAKDRRFCPIGTENWYLMNKQLQADIIQAVRAKFIIPDEREFNHVILVRVAKFCRNYKYKLKKEKFNPHIRTKEQIYNDVPHGQDRNEWMRLVQSWYSEKNKKLSLHGKEARASQSYVHTTGTKSYANKRDDFVDTMGRQPSHMEFFTLTHTRVDGTFVDNTLASEFLVEANEKVKELAVTSSKSELELQNGVFNSLMFEEGKPKRPIGFGLGVKGSDIFGVNSLVKKRGYDDVGNIKSCVEMENLKATVSNLREESQVQLANVRKENEELRAKFDQSNQILLQALNAFHTGKVSSDFLKAAQSVLEVPNSQSMEQSATNSQMSRSKEF